MADKKKAKSLIKKVRESVYQRLDEAVTQQMAGSGVSLNSLMNPIRHLIRSNHEDLARSSYQT